MTLSPGMAVVVMAAVRPTEKPSQKIAKVSAINPTRVRLWMCNWGGVKWAPKSRAVTAVEVLREATPREVALGMLGSSPTGPVAGLSGHPDGTVQQKAMSAPRR